MKLSSERAELPLRLDESTWPEELEVFYTQERDRLVRFALVLTGDRAEAEDLVQDAFVRIHRFRRRAGAQGLLTYARRTVLNLARSRFRRARVRLNKGPIPPVDVEALTIEERDWVWDEVMRLSARQRACIALRFYEDLSEREIAEVLGLRVGSVKRHMSRGMQRLRHSLREATDETR